MSQPWCSVGEANATMDATTPWGVCAPPGTCGGVGGVKCSAHGTCIQVGIIWGLIVTREADV